MADIKRTASGIFISGVPDNLSREEKIALLDRLEGSVGAFSGSYSDAQGAVQAAGSIERSRGREQELEQPPLTREQQVEQQASQAEANAPETTAGGMLGGIAREAAPTGIAATIGLPIAAAERITHAITPAIADFVNEKLGLKGTKYEQMSSQEMYDFIADKMGVQKPDTPAEQLVASGARGGAEALGALGGAEVLQTGMAALGPGSRLQQIGQVLGEKPLTQLIGGIFAGSGAEKGAQIAEEKEMGVAGQILMPLAGGILGDITGSGLAGIGESVSKIMTARNMDLPDAAAEAIRLSQGRGETFLSDIEPGTARGERGRSLREAIPGGTQDLRYARNQLRKQQIYDVMDDFGVVEGDYYARDIIDDFLNKRGDLLSKWKGEKDEVIERLSRGGLDVGEAVAPDAAVNTQATIGIIGDKAAELSALGDASLEPLIRTLHNWEAALDNKNLSQIEFLRKRLRNTFEDPNLAPVKDDGERIAREVYNSLNNDMGEHIKSVGSEADFNKWSMANNALKDMMKDFEVPALAKLINDGKADASAVTRSLFSDDLERVQNLYDRLTPKGRERSRSAIMAQMAKDASDLGDLSPNQFARQIENMGPSHQVFFREQDGAQLEGLRKWLEFTKRDEFPVTSVRPGEGVPGGQYALSRGLWSDPRIGIPLALAGRAGAGKFTQFLERGEARDLMIKLAAIPEDKLATAGQETFKRLGEMYRAYMGAQEGREPQEGRTRGIGQEER